MLKKTSLTLLLVILYLSSIAQNCNCDKLLQGGLYSFTKMTNTGSFNSDLRTYYLSEQFRADMSNGKWGSSVSIPILGDILSIGANSSSQQWSEWRSKLLSISSLSIGSNNYQTVFSSIPNTNLYEAYTKCIEICARNGVSGFVPGINVETEDAVVFTIYYKPSAPNDPMPKVTSFHVEPEGSVISGNLTVGQRLTSYSVLVTCRKNPDKDIILTLQTDRGSISSKSVADGSLTSSSGVPIGTVITSFLSFKDFNAATKNNEKSPGGIWTSNKSKWAPCDGRPLPYSKYSILSSQTNAPDLRGLFLRGSKTFDPDYTIPSVEASQQQAQPNPVGVFQPDIVGPHNHPFHYPGYHNSDKVDGGGNYPRVMLEEGGNQTTSNNNGAENIPKNIAIYYYIKIN